MNYPLISEYIDAILNAEDNFDKLSHLRPVLDDDGQPIMSSGNFAVVFKMTDGEKYYAVKCFTKDQEGREIAYSAITKELDSVNSSYFCKVKYYKSEIFVDTNQSMDTEYPVLLMDWIEGQTLSSYLSDIWAACDLYEEEIDDIKSIYQNFVRMANWLLKQPFAHGDLKPDNIIVCPDKRLKIIDYDGMYIPEMENLRCSEYGSPDFSNPLVITYNQYIDDFALVIIALSLKMIQLDPTLATENGVLFHKEDFYNLASSDIFAEVWSKIDNIDIRNLLSSLLHLLSFGSLKDRMITFVKSKKKQLNVLTDEKEYNVIKNICDYTKKSGNGIITFRYDQYGAMYSLDGKILGSSDISSDAAIM